METWRLWPLSLLVAMLAPTIRGHGRLIEPPSRGTMWRYGFSSPPNYNDHELFCGGFTRQWQRNGGKCGICGDPWDSPKPRAHEAGGKYAQGVIVRRYKRDSSVTIRVELTANHHGYFEFRLCPNNAPKHAATQGCLDKHVLRRAKLSSKEENGLNHETRYHPGLGNKVFEVRYSLPKGLTCSQCILQWRYIAGNNWGMCSNGTGAVGCGPQEEFRACADVAIVERDGTADDTPFEGEDNEITSEEPNVGIAAAVEEPWGWVVVLIVVCTLLAVLMMLASVLLYYYKGRDAVKKLLGRGKFWGKQDMVPIPPPRIKKQLNILNNQI